MNNNFKQSHIHKLNDREIAHILFCYTHTNDGRNAFRTEATLPKIAQNR